ncbi:hypothetical protein ACSLNN_26025, partial [Escherichia coli]|uniref:hypothetical protein n=1 Tax=Escherichia coli TaxID=562 RepID=UPI003EE041DD
PFAGSETGFFPAHYGIPVPPIASGEYGKNRTKTAMIFSGWQQWGKSGLAALRAQLLKREEELRRKEQEDTERSRAEQLRKN